MSTNPPEGQSYQPPASGYAAPNPGYAAAPPVPHDAPKPKGSSTLGLIAFVASLAAVIIGSILAYVAGASLGPLAQYSNSSGVIDESTLDSAATQAAATGGILTFAAFGVYGILGLWGFIQGIVAAVKNRGRGWGITAIILAVIGGGIVGVVLVVAIGANAVGYLPA